MSFKERVDRIRNHFDNYGCDALLVEDRVNLFYLTGFSLSAGKLLIDREKAHLIVDSRYEEACRTGSPFPVVLAKNGALAELIREIGGIKNLGFNSQKVTYGGFIELEKEIGKAEKVHLVPVDHPVEKLRAVKDSEEASILREAASLGSEGYDFVCRLLREGITEQEIALELEIFWKRKGSQAIAFDPIIAFGPNSSMPHYRVGSTKLEKGACVLIDIGVTYQHYHSDMTRVVFFGEPDPKIAQIYEVVRRAQQAALKLCREGTSIGELDSAARDLIESEGYGENFTHSLGHGIGLDVHEFPIIRNKPPYSDVRLQEGMVITVEPGIYLPGVGGVRLEDTVLIKKEGFENLTDRPVEISVRA